MRVARLPRPDSELRRILIVIAFSLDHDLFDEVSNDLGSFRWGALEHGREADRAIEHFPSLGRWVWPYRKRSISSAGLVSCVGQDPDPRRLRFPGAGSRQPWDWSVPALR